MSIVNLLFRITLFGIVLVAYFVSSLMLLIINLFSFNKARPNLTKVIAITSKLGLIIFNIKVKKTMKNANQHLAQNHLIVSNHLTYLDILVISSLYPTCFVTSVEMKQTPFLGQLCLLGGCLFVERRSKKGIGDEVLNLTKAIESGLNVVIFPEATSTNGESVIKFKRPLFQAAINAKASVLPICLNYKKLGNENVSLKNRDHVFWYDATPFHIHAFKLFSYPKIEVEILVMDEIDSTKFQDKLELSEKCYEAVNSGYRKVIT